MPKLDGQTVQGILHEAEQFFPIYGSWISCRVRPGAPGGPPFGRLACGKHPASHRLVSRRFLLHSREKPRPV